MAAPQVSISRRRLWLLVALAAVLGVTYVGWHTFATTSSVEATADARKVDAAIPVTTARVQNVDFPVYLNGLGTVQPYQTVTVRSRVDGQIIKVHFKQARMVNEGDILVEIDPRPYQAALDQALAKKAQDEANLKNAELTLQRLLTLVDKAVVSRQQVDTQQAVVDQLAAQIRGDEAAIENARTQLSYTIIRSPITGRAGFRLVDRGNIVRATDQTGIVTIIRLQPISVVFTAPEENLQQITRALGQGTVPVRALSSDGLRILSDGRLSLVDNEIDHASGTIRMKATFQNADNVLWPGLSVATRLLVETLKQATVVPDDAVQRGPNGLYVFVVDDDNKVRVQAVRISHSGEGCSVVEQGLTPGQQVVVAGQYRLRPGSVVQPTEKAVPAVAAATAPARDDD
jgi:membrane fusion protein, multidrug efflux system